MSRRKASKLFLETFAARLNEVVAGRQPAMLAREIGITSATALKAYLDGKAIPLADNLHEMAKYFGKPMDWFFGADPPTEDELLSDHIMIPMYHVEAAAGLEGIVNGDSPGEPDDRYPFKLSWLATRGYGSTERLQQLMLIRVRGNSMDPTISDGEVVLVDLAEASRLPDAIKNGGVYLVRWGRALDRGGKRQRTLPAKADSDRRQAPALVCSRPGDLGR